MSLLHLLCYHNYITISLSTDGYYDYSSFHDPLGNFDFCTSDSDCQASDYDCTLNVTDAGGDGASAVDPDGP